MKSMLDMLCLMCMKYDVYVSCDVQLIWLSWPMVLLYTFALLSKNIISTSTVSFTFSACSPIFITSNLLPKASLAARRSWSRLAPVAP